MRYLFKRDAIMATVMVFMVIGILVYIPLNTHIFNPIEISLSDFSSNDLAFSKAHEQPHVDQKIVIVNIDTANRKTIAEILTKLGSYKPRVIGLDVLFDNKTEEGNSALEKAMGALPNLVTSERLHYNTKNSSYTPEPNMFYKKSPHYGFVNLVGEDNGVIRYYRPFIEDSDLMSFSSAVIKQADSAAYKKLSVRKNDFEWINYQRNDSGYFTIQYPDLLVNKVEPNFLKDKIILVGYINHSPYNIEDKHFTPLNEKLFGRSIPDMNGVVIHANIISMALDGNYIMHSPVWLNFCIAVLITWLHIAFLLKYYIHKHRWFHIVVKTVELLIGAVLIYLNILALRYLNISIDFTLTLLAIIIAVDVLYFYEGIANWLSLKFSIKSVFDQMHHP